MKKVLFVCIRNAGRSQMAGAFAQKYGEGRIIAATGGTHPTDRVHPVVIEAMREKGLDLSKNTPRQIEITELNEADQVVVMGCGAESFCPATLLEHVIDWNLEDPQGQSIEKVREIRDEIERRVIKLIETLAPLDG